MLIQQELDDIVDASTSEQIAYLLVERARLMDDVDGFREQALFQTPEGPMSAEHIWNLLQTERKLLTAEKAKQSPSSQVLSSSSSSSSGMIETPEGMMTGSQLWALLQQERQDFEEELRQQRENMKRVKEQMRSSQEEELSALMEESDRLQAAVEEKDSQVRNVTNE